MQVSFSSNKFRKICEDEKALKMTYGDRAQSIIQRINEFMAAESLFDISKLPHTRLHPLTRDLKGYYAVHIKQPYRIVLWPENGDRSDWKTITKIEIVKIEDYH